MTPKELLAHLRSLNITLWIEEDRLRFKAPKGSLPPELRTQLVEHKAEIMAFLREAEQAKVTARPSIQPIPREGSLPLSFPQQRLWFLDQLESGTAAYNIFDGLRLTGSL